MRKGDIINILKSGGVGVLPTDTIYGLVGRALTPRAVKRIYTLKKRARNKPFIILISRLEDLELFDIKLDKNLKSRLGEFWPGPTSIIINNIAFRLPKLVWLRKVISETGPLIATSANPEGKPPAEDIIEAKRYFGQNIDFYLAGKTGKKPSRLIKFWGKKVLYLR
ncbi:L-threonylcarbamoyladenylate synthase [Candidatus Nomurabacteria bacterium]|nr:L-threonylcarbamoyladenylate synthase [Candidatus Nomurabacteria bacterium]